MSALNNLMHAISDHGNIVASKALTFFGVTSVGGGLAGGVVSGTAHKIAESQAFGLPDWAAVVSIIGGLSLIIKNAVDVYYSRLDRKDKDRRERDRRMSDIAESYMEEDK